jgi:hypothetical protein
MCNNKLDNTAQFNFSALACIAVGFFKKASPGDVEAALCVRSRELAGDKG